MIFECVLVFATFINSVTSACYDPSPAFPVPSWRGGASTLRAAFESIESQVHELVAQEQFNRSSFSIEVTSNTETLFGTYHTAKLRDESRPGAAEVNGDSVYRIASISKTFTVLAILQQHDAGKLHLDDPVSKYISELAEDGGAIPWKSITLRILGSQLSGIPREFAQSDLITQFDDPTKLGLPPVTRDGLLTCGEYQNFSRPCNQTDFISRLRELKPLLPPNFKSTYSNVAFNLLGLVIANVTGVNYEDYVQHAVFDKLGLSSTSFEAPGDKYAVLPLLKDGKPTFWGLPQGIQNPTGGIYSSSHDLSRYTRYVLTHYNDLATGVNWFLPQSFATGIHTFYGMPWEMFRLPVASKGNRRPVDGVTKGGSLPGYYTRLWMLPEYGLGFNVLTGGTPDLVNRLQSIVARTLVPVAEEKVWAEVDQTYSGTYIALDTSLNSSITLKASLSKGLEITSFISNNTDILKSTGLIFADPDDPEAPSPKHLQLIPTTLYKNDSTRQGEIWRMLLVPDRSDASHAEDMALGSEDDDACATDIDPVFYAGLPVTELVFWHEREEIELPAWQVKLRRPAGHVGDGLRVQSPPRAVDE